MATKDGLKKKRKNYTKIFKKDLILCAKFEDIYGFFSFSELYDEKPFKNSVFIDVKNKNYSFDQETKNKLNKNRFIGIDSSVFSKTIIKKKNIYTIFGFNDMIPSPEKSRVIKKGKLKESFYSISNYLNGTTGVSSENFLSDGNINLVNSSGRDDCFLLRVMEDDFLVPTDLEDFASKFLLIKKSNLKNLTLKVSDLPRLCQQSLLENILVQEGRKELSQGDLCYTIVPYKNKSIALFANADINEENIIVKINNKEYINDNFIFKTRTTKSCEPSNFRVNDTVIGYYKNGIYLLNNRVELDKLESSERSYFNKFLGSYNSSPKLEALKNKFRYPKSLLNILVIRNSLDISVFGDRSAITGYQFSEGLYNTLSLNKPISYGSRVAGKSIFGLNLDSTYIEMIIEFRTKLIGELISFIKNRFYFNLTLEAKTNPAKKQLLDYINELENEILQENQEYRRRKKIRKSKPYFNRLLSNKKRFSEKSTFVFIMTSLTGIRDPNAALIEFFNIPSIFHGDTNTKQYETLRHLSYFILCDKLETCSRIIPVKNEISYNITYPFLIKQTEDQLSNTYKLYFNTRLEMFTDFEIIIN